MTRTPIVAALAATLFASVAWAQDACIVYENTRFRGDSYRFNEETPPGLDSSRWRGRISSAAIADGCRLTLYDRRRFRGDSITFEGDVSFVGRQWNDRAVSAACECDYDRGRGGRRAGGRDDERFGPSIGRGDPPRLRRRGYACNVFREKGFRGPWRAFRADEKNRELGRRLNGDVSSVQVARGCFAIIDIGRSYRIMVEQDVPRFGPAVNDRAESVSCYCDR